MSFTSWLRTHYLTCNSHATSIVCATAVLALFAPTKAAAVDTEPINNSQLTADSLNMISGTAVSNLASLGIEYGDPSGDVDFFQTPLAADEVLFGMVTPNVDLTSLGLGLPPGFVFPDTIVSLFDDSGPWTFNGQDYAGDLTAFGLSNGSLFRFEAPATSVYRIGVGGYSDLEFAGVSLNPINETGSYILTAGRVNPAIPGGGFSDIDPDNQTAAGADLIAVTPGTARVAVAQLGESDVDFFRLDLKAGDVLSTMTAPLNHLSDSFDDPDTMLGLFDSSGSNLLVVNDDAGKEFDDNPLASDFPFDEFVTGSGLRALIPEDGAYYLAVTGYGDDGFTGAHVGSGSYALLVGVAGVPEPATVVLFGVALVGLGVAFRPRIRRRRSQLELTSGATRSVCAAALAAITLTAPAAAYVDVIGGPAFISDIYSGSVVRVNNAGVAVGDLYTEASDLENSYLPILWDSSGAPASELGLGSVADINEVGTAVGGTSHVGFSGQFYLAVRWDASGTVETELQSLSHRGAPFDMSSHAYSINNAGAAVGWAEKWNETAGYQGYRPVRWDAAGAVTELDSLGFYSQGTVINDAGVAVGWSVIPSSIGFWNRRAVRWDASGTAVTELDNLGVDDSGVTATHALDVNNAGTTVGWAHSYDEMGEFLGQHAVRWDAAGTAATKLDNLGTDESGVTNSSAIAINNAGTAVGNDEKYDETGVLQRRRAVRWDASGTVATELGNLGTNASGLTATYVSAINEAGIAVGYAYDYDDLGNDLGWRAVYWALDDVAVDLNTLIDPASAWTLSGASAISNTGWIAGVGWFDPDGAGGQQAYARLFLMQVPAPNFLPGDFNHDGAVDAADYVVWRKGILVAPTNENYNVWRSHFGQSVGTGAGVSGSASAAVPEPAVAVTILLAVLSLLVIPRHRGMAKNRC